MTIETLEDVITILKQLVPALHINVGADNKFIPKAAEPKLRHILINTERRMAQTRGGFSVPVEAGYVWKHVELPKSHVALGIGVPQAPGAVFVEHPTLQAGETASADELAAIVAAPKPATAQITATSLAPP